MIDLILWPWFDFIMPRIKTLLEEEDFLYSKNYTTVGNNSGPNQPGLYASYKLLNWDDTGSDSSNNSSNQECEKTKIWFGIYWIRGDTQRSRPKTVVLLIQIWFKVWNLTQRTDKRCIDCIIFTLPGPTASEKK